MADHTIHFTPEQSLLLDKLISDKNEAEKAVMRLERELEQAKMDADNSKILHRSAQAAVRELSRQVEEKQFDRPDEEEIRQSERERIAAWFDARGQEDDHFYQSYGNGVSTNAGYLASAIRRKDHYLTYYEYRKDQDDEWPEAYAVQPEDMDFDVHARIWER